MRSVGKVIKDARVKKRISKSALEDKTKIKADFIDALEKENWDNLPEYPVLQGFVRNISSVLKLDTKQMIALLRRDYPPRDLRINPKPDVSEKFSWSPKLTFLLGVAVISLIVITYLVFQYFSFVSPPKLIVTTPDDGQIVDKAELTVSGTTSPEASVLVNNQPTLVDSNGNFSTIIDIFQGTSEVVVTATSRSGKETVVHRKIVPDLPEP